MLIVFFLLHSIAPSSHASSSNLIKTTHNHSHSTLLIYFQSISVSNAQADANPLICDQNGVLRPQSDPSNQQNMQDNEFMEAHTGELSSTKLFQLLELSPARKKLKKMTSDFFTPSAPLEIAAKVKPLPNTHHHSDQNTPPNAIDPQTGERLHQTDPGTAPSPSNDPIPPRKLSSSIRRSTTSANSLIYRPLPAQAYENTLLQRDKEKDPLKYKIISESLGVEEKRVLRLKKDEIDRIKEEYLKNKGIQYLREGSLQARREKRSKTETSLKEDIPPQKNQFPRDYVRQIFADRAEANKVKVERHEEQSKKQARLSDLNDQEEMLGKVVFHRVKKHLQAERNGMDYFKRIRNEETIDSALIDFLRTKVQKAQLALH